MLLRSSLLALALLCATVSLAHGTMVVEAVLPDSPAAAAGLRAGDTLLRIDGRAMIGFEDLKRVIATRKPGDAVEVAVLRGEETVALRLTFGELPEGGVSIGVRLSVGPGDPAESSAEQDAGRDACLARVEKTYRVASLMQELGLDLADDYAAVRECIGRNTRQLGAENAIKFCDNLFKVHCPGLDLLAEIGEAQVRRCAELLHESLGLSVKQHRGWKSCAQHAVFDRYSRDGESSDADACAAALLESCGTNLDAAIESGSLSAEQRGFVECCSAEALDAGPRDESDPCHAIDDGFSRGPCRDRPVCVNRSTGEWLRCPVSP